MPDVVVDLLAVEVVPPGVVELCAEPARAPRSPRPSVAPHAGPMRTLDDRQRRFMDVVVANAVERIKDAVSPNRRRAIFSASATCGSFIAGGWLDEATAVDALTAACEELFKDDLPLWEVVHSHIADGIAKGKLDPQDVPEAGNLARQARTLRKIAVAPNPYEFAVNWLEGVPDMVAVAWARASEIRSEWVDALEAVEHLDGRPAFLDLVARLDALVGRNTPTTTEAAS